MQCFFLGEDEMLTAVRKRRCPVHEREQRSARPIAPGFLSVLPGAAARVVGRQKHNAVQQQRQL